MNRRETSLSKNTLTILKARRTVLSLPPYVHEFLVFTRERVIVIRQSTKLPYYASTSTQVDVDNILPELLKTTSIDDILRADRHNFATPNSEIKKVELKKRWEGERLGGETKSWEGADLNIMTHRKTFKWNDLNIPEKKDEKLKKWITIRDYEDMLRPIFGDRLYVRLAMPLQGAPGYP